MKKFEYKSVDCSLPSGVEGMVKELNRLGKEGWELVSVSPSDSSEYGLSILTAFLKREIVK